MQLYKWLVILTFGLLIFSACEDLVEEVQGVDVPEHESKLAVSFRIYDTDSCLYAFVSNSVGVLGQEQSGVIMNATVEVQKDSQAWVSLSFTENSGAPLFIPYIYEKELGAKVGGDPIDYTLMVNAPGFKSIEATRTMPTNLTLVDASFSFGTGVNTNGDTTNLIELAVEDDVDLEQFYSIKMFFVNAYGGDTNSIDTVVFDAKEITFHQGFPGEILFKDEGFNGEEKILEFNTFNSYDTLAEEAFLVIQTQSLNKEGFQYSRSLNNYIAEADNPFAEPVIVPSSFDNGFGVFELRSTADLVVQLK